MLLFLSTYFQLDETERIETVGGIACLRRPNLESLDLSEVVRRHSDLDYSSSLVDEAFLFFLTLGWMQSWDKFIFHQREKGPTSRLIGRFSAL